MHYCINPLCFARNNPDDAQICQNCGTPLAVNDRYHLLSFLLDHPHPYTEVFEVEDLANNQQRKVLKVLTKTNDPKLVELFEQESNLLLSLKNSGIPKFEDYFSVIVFNSKQQELRCLVMEKIEGLNLEQWLESHGKLEDKKIALNWLKQLATTLGYVHANNLFHRDIKPSNIMRKPDGRLVLIDFGTARKVTSTVLGGKKVITVVHSEVYTAPEQREGKAVPQSDFYALGQTFVHLLTGKHLDDPGFARNLWQYETEFPTSQIIALINSLSEQKPQARPQASDDIINKIERICSEELTPPTPGGGAGVPIQPTRNLLNIAAKGVAIVMGAAAIVVGLAILNRQLICANVPALDVPALGFCPPVVPLPPPEELISAGEKALDDSVVKLDEPYEELKNQGIKALSSDKYDEAIKAFQQVREIATKKKKEEEERNAKDSPQWKAALAALQDPVTLIFLNNAKARKNAKENGSPLYTIAAAVPLNQEEGKQILLGVAQVQDKVVAKQNSLNLEVVIANDRNIPAQAKSVAEALVKNQDILAVVGHYTSPNTCAALSVYNKNKRVVISPTSTVADLRTRCGGDSNKVFFRTTSTTQVEAETLINHLFDVTNDANTQPKIAVFFTRGEMFSEDLSNQFRQILKGKGTIIDEIDLAQDFDVKQKLEEVKDADAIAVFPDGKTGNSSSFDRAIKVIVQNAGNKLVLGNNALYEQSVINQIRDAGLNNKFVIAVDWQRDQYGTKKFVESANKLWFGDVNRRTALSYEAVQAVLETLYPGIRPSHVQQELLNNSKARSDVIEGKPISFDRNGDRKEITTRDLAIVCKEGDQYKFFLLKSDRC